MLPSEEDSSATGVSESPIVSVDLVVCCRDRERVSADEVVAENIKELLRSATPISALPLKME
jgi:hypothetical protein